MDVSTFFKDWPPVTRVMVPFTFALSILIHGGLISAYPFWWYWPFVFRTDGFPQIWRFFTSFCVTGGNMAILLDPYLLYTYSSGLERGSPRFTEPGSYVVFVGFCMTVITFLSSIWFGGFLFLHPLTLAMAYIFAQDNPNANVTIFILTFPAKYLPYALLMMDWIYAGHPSGMLSQIPGLLAAHLYDFLTRIWPTFGGGTNYIFTPEFIKRWYSKMEGRVQRREYGSAIRPADGARDGDGWAGQRGPGRRLG